MLRKGADDFQFLKAHICLKVAVDKTKKFVGYTNDYIVFKLNLRKEKWLLLSVCRPPAENKACFFYCLSQIIGFPNIANKKQIITGCFN